MIANLTLIQTFYLVAHEGSFSAASRSLGISYQSITNHVRKLEQIVGDRLIESEKGGRNIELTSRGRILYNLLHPELDAILKRLTSIVNSERPLLRLGMPSAAFYFLLAEVVSDIQQAFPGIEVQTMERDTELQELIMDGCVDVCISDAFYGNPTVPQRLLGKYKLVLIYPSGWDALTDVQHIAQWADGKPFLTYEPGQSVRNLAIDYLSKEGVTPIVSISTSSSLNLCRCVENGLGFSILPGWCFDRSKFDVQCITLDNMPEMSLYFGYAQYLENNLYVSSLLKACETFLQEKIPEIYD